MLVQHLLTERIFRKVFNNQEFLSRNVIAAEIEKVIRSAIANASEQNTTPRRNAFYVAEARVDAGPVIKRFQPKDRGKAYSIMKRTSHLVVSIEERQK